MSIKLDTSSSFEFFNRIGFEFFNRIDFDFSFVSVRLDLMTPLTSSSNLSHGEKKNTSISSTITYCLISFKGKQKLVKP